MGTSENLRNKNGKFPNGCLITTPLTSTNYLELPNNSRNARPKITALPRGCSTTELQQHMGGKWLKFLYDVWGLGKWREWEPSANCSRVPAEH